MKEAENFRFEQDEMEMRLWDYIDGIAAGEQRKLIEDLLSSNQEWKLKYEALLAVHQSLNLVELEQPSLRFTRNVMEEIAKLQIAPAAKNYINSRIIYGIAGFFITIILSFLVYAISQIKWNAANQNDSVLGIDFTSVDYSGIFNNTFVNAFMMANVLLGLMLFDRYLDNKKKEMRKNLG
jgi:hypothetical protein